MTNAIYPLWKQALMRENDANKSLDQGGLFPVNGVYVSLVTIAGGYVYSDAHQFYSSITNVSGVPQIITAPTVIGKVFDGNDVVFTNVTGTNIGAIVLARQNSGGAGTWRLVLYEDTGIIGMPLATNGGNVIITWNTQGILAL